MSIQECAAAAVATWPWVAVQTPLGSYPAPVVMVAIGGAESGWLLQPCGVVGPCDPSYATTYNCQGRNAAGWLQIELVHGSCLQALGAGSTPCEWFAWLSASALNCASAARRCLTGAVPSQGSLSAWTTFSGGQWAQYIPKAMAACSAARGAAGTSSTSSASTTGYVPPGTPAPFKSGPTRGQVASGLVVLGLLTTGVILLAERAREGENAPSA